MNSDEGKAQEASAPSINKYSIFGHEVNGGTIRILAIMATVCYIIPTSDVWEKAPEALSAKTHGLAGTIFQILNAIIEAVLAIPMWVSVLLMAIAMVLLLAALAEKVGATDSKNRIALYILSAILIVFAVMTMAFSFPDDSDAAAEVGDLEIIAGLFALLVMFFVVVCLAALEIYIGVRFGRSGVKRYKDLGLCFVINAIVGCLILLFGTLFDDYSVGAKIISLLDKVNECVLIYFIYVVLTNSVKKNNIVKSVTEYGLVIYGILVMLFAVEVSFDPTIQQSTKEKEIIINTKTTTEDDEDDYLNDLFDLDDW